MSEASFVLTWPSNRAYRGWFLKGEPRRVVCADEAKDAGLPTRGTIRVQCSTEERPGWTVLEAFPDDYGPGWHGRFGRHGVDEFTSHLVHALSDALDLDRSEPMKVWVLVLDRHGEPIDVEARQREADR